MQRKFSRFVLASVLFALLPGAGFATTREIAELEPARLSFRYSILNQLSNDIYRDPFDELQTRPYNLLFNNIGRHPNLSPWQGQEGSHARYLNALIGNNGTANVDNDADSIQGSLVRRETDALAWGVSAAFLAGSDGSSDVAGIVAFSDQDDLSGFDVRAAAALQLTERRVLGGGIRVTRAVSEVTDSSFEQGVGGFVGADEFNQFDVQLDVGLRQFQNARASWEAQLVVGFGGAEQDSFSEDIDDTGAVTDRFVVMDYDISELHVGIYGGYNRLKSARLGETEFRAGLERSQRELDNSDLSYSESGGVVTPSLTLLGQDAIAATRLSLSAKSIFEAGETEMFAGAQLGYGMVDGGTQVDAAGMIVNEQIDDAQLGLALTVGLRKPVMGDKLRFIVSGRADLLDGERATIFDAASQRDDFSRSSAQYAIGLEGVLANVVFDVAWLRGEEAPVAPVDLGLPGGSRRSVELDRLIFSAAVAW